MEPLKVFISSVMRRNLEDLTAEREAAREAVNSFRPVTRTWAFEKEPASTKALRDSYIDEVKTCDLLLLIVGRTMTEPVREELVTARDYRKPILAFAKKISREQEAAKLLHSLDAKYDTFSDVADLGKKVQAALGQEILRRAKPGSAERFQAGDRVARLRAFVRENRTVRVSPLVPPCQYDQFTVSGHTSDTLSLDKGSNNQRVDIPISRITDILVTGEHEVPMLLLDGRIQWVSLPQRWRFFPEKPSGHDPFGLGCGRATALRGPTIDAIVAKLRSSGWEPGWKRKENIDDLIARGGGVYYGDNGHYFFANELVLCIRPALG